LETAAWDAVLKVLFTAGFLDSELQKFEVSSVEQQIRRDLKGSEQKKRKLEKALKGVIDAQSWSSESGVVREALKTKLDELDRQIAEVDRQIVTLKQRLVPFQDAERARSDIQERIAVYRDKAASGGLTLEQKRDVLQGLGVKVFAGRDRR
jgi:hypothetical protein